MCARDWELGVMGEGEVSPEELVPVSRTAAGEDEGCFQLGERNTLATSPAPALTCDGIDCD